MTPFTYQQLLRLMRRRKYPAIPEPHPDVESLHKAVAALKEAVELLTAQRRPESAAVTAAVTRVDLALLGLIDENQIHLDLRR